MLALAIIVVVVVTVVADFVIVVVGMCFYRRVVVDASFDYVLASQLS